MEGVFLELKLFFDCEKCQSVGYDDFFLCGTQFLSDRDSSYLDS